MSEHKRTKEMEDKIGLALSLGLTERTAAISAGVNPKTFQSWKKREPAFAGRIAQKKAEGKVYVAGKLRQSIDDGVVAAQIYWLKVRAKEDGFAEETRAIRHDDLPEDVKEQLRHSMREELLSRSGVKGNGSSKRTTRKKVGGSPATPNAKRSSGKSP